MIVKAPNTSNTSERKYPRDVPLPEDSPADELLLLCVLLLGALVCPSQETGNTAKTQ